MNTFQEMGLPKALLHSLNSMQFTKPTPIQSKAIPVAMSGNDILGSAQTGTGKTVAFGVPLIARILSNNVEQALVMTPTRELAAQVMNQLQVMLGKKSGIRTALLIGGEPIFKQFSQLRANPKIIVGTPGRINDHLKRKSLDLKKANFLVLDETDRMLDMGFSIQIKNIIKSMSTQRQTLLFSATLPSNITQIAEKYLTNPVRIEVKTKFAPGAHVKQDMVHIREFEKYSSLLSQLDERKGSVIVFVKTKHGTQRMADNLVREGYSADAIHGDLRQNKRDRVISAFRLKKYRILVATDVAARGLDINHIEHVVNYDLPQCPEDYIHRIGRTARAGAEGSAVNFITPADKRKWNLINQVINPNAKSDFKRPKTKPDVKRRNSNNRKNLRANKIAK